MDFYRFLLVALLALICDIDAQLVWQRVFL